MKTKLEKLENRKLKLEVTVEEAEMQEAMERAARELGNKVKVPGFRKGKVPRSVIEARFGKGAIMEEALENLLPETYAKAVEEHDLEPIDNPEINIIEADPEKPLVYEATVQLRPEAELGQYKDIEAEKEEYAVTDEDVEHSIDRLRERHSKMVNVDSRSVENEDHIVMDFKGFVDGEAFEGGSAEGYSLEVGSGSFIPGFEEQLVGATPKEEVDVNVTFPEDYHAEQLAGKEAVFKVTVHEIKRKELPALDDDFAKTAGDFETLQELKEDMKKNLEKTAEDTISRNFENAVLTKVVEGASVSIPEVMVKKRVERMLDQMAEDLKRQGLSMEDYQKYLNKTDEELREDMKPNAEREVRTELVLEAVVKAEGIEATEDDVNAEIDKIAEVYTQEADTVRKAFEAQGTIPVIEENIRLRKAIEFLKEKAKPVMVKASNQEEE